MKKGRILGMCVIIVGCVMMSGCGQQETSRSEIISEVLEDREAGAENPQDKQTNVQNQQESVEKEKPNVTMKTNAEQEIVENVDKQVLSQSQPGALKNNRAVKNAGITNTTEAANTTGTENITEAANTTETAKATETANIAGTANAAGINGNAGTMETGVIAHTCTWGDAVATMEANCGTEGTRTYTCTVCGKTRTESIAKTGTHDFQKRYWPSEPTCTVGAYYNWVCTKCGEHSTSGDEPPKGHTIGRSEEIQHGNCVAQTIINNYCGECGELVSQDAYTEFDQHEWVASTFPELNLEIGEWEDVTRTFCKYCHMEKTE